MKAIYLKIGLFWALLLWLSVAQAGSAIERLHTFFTVQGVIRAQFEQTVQGAVFAQPEVMRGTLVMQRPGVMQQSEERPLSGRFRWDYEEPYQQQIVADGKRLWIYDVDLEQVLVKPLDAALGDTPALLLSGSGKVEERFVIEELPDTDGLAWVKLTPRQSDTGFTELRLGFDARHLRQMELTDGFAQVTRLVFSDVVYNADIDSAAFHFEPPPGVDVIGQGKP